MRHVAMFTLAAMLLGGSYLGLNSSAEVMAQVQPGKVAPLPPPAPPESPTTGKAPAVPAVAGEGSAIQALKTDRESKAEAKEAQAEPKSSKETLAKKEEHGTKAEPGKMEKASGDERPLTAAQQADEHAIRLLAKSFAKAYHEGNAKAAAAHFTSDAEYVDEHGNVAQGQREIEDGLTEFFGDHPSCQLEFDIESIRFIAPGVAVEDGTTKIIHTQDGGAVTSCYTATHVKQADGKWLTASIRDRAPKYEKTRSHAAQLKQLDWLLGDWIDEGEDSLVMFSCASVDGGNYLVRKFTVHIHGQESMSGTQRIGFDPVSGKFRVWLFDSEGGYAQGTLRPDGEDRWILRMAGTNADGDAASGTSIYTVVNNHTMTWKNVDHEVAGEQMLDSEEVTIVKQAPQPLIAEKLAE